MAFAPWNFHVSVSARLADDERRAAIERALVRWYREQASTRLAEKIERWAKIAGYRPSGVMIRDQRQRWGSCSPSGVLRFNWRIVMAPPALISCGHRYGRAGSRLTDNEYVAISGSPFQPVLLS